MMLARWEPFRGIAALERAMNQRFESPSLPALWARGDGLVGLDVYEEEDKVVVTLSLPGFKAGEVQVSVAGDILTIEGQSAGEQEEKERDYLVRGRRYGALHRAVRLPSGLNTGGAEAALKDGVLTVTFPKAEENKGKRIEVKAAS